jgi:hypothetical protein
MIRPERLASPRGCARLALSCDFGMWGGTGRGLILTGLLRPSLASLHCPSQPQGIILPYCKYAIIFAPRGESSSTVTTQSERCTSSRSMGNSSGTRYPPQSMWSSAMPHRETSHKSSVVNPIGPQSPPQRPEGKMPLSRGGQSGRL